MTACASPTTSATAVRRSMLANRGTDTGPELRLRSALHRGGLRFRKHVRPVESLRCTADIVLRRHRVAVFVDGCFWHSCPEHATRPKTNAEWWRAKLDRTVERDRRNNVVLLEHGWSVVRLWEHQSLDEAVASVLSAITDSNPRI
jgi:DNA mismatch endonuclease (patch repair protein)